MKPFLLIFFTTFLFIYQSNAQKNNDIAHIVSKYSEIFEWVIQPKYDDIKNVPESNILTAQKGGKYGYITLEEKVIVPFEWKYASNAYSCGIGVVGKTELGWRYLLDLNNKGKKVTEEKFQHVEHFYDGYAVVGTPGNSKYGIINSLGNFVIPYKFGIISPPENIKDILEGRSTDLIPARVFKNSGLGLHGLINGKGEWVLKPTYELTYMRRYDYYKIAHLFFREGIVDSTGKELIPPDYKKLNSISPKLIAADNKDKWGIINLKNEIIIPFEYDLISKRNSEGKVNFEKGNEYGYISADDAKVEVKGTLSRKPIKSFYGYPNNNSYGIYKFEEEGKSKPYGICYFENDHIKIKTKQEFQNAYIRRINGKEYIIVRKKVGSDYYYGMYNNNMKLIIDPDLKEFNSIGIANSQGFLSVKIKGKSGVAKYKF